MTFMLTLADISGDTWSEDILEQRKVLGRAETAEIRLDHALHSEWPLQFVCACQAYCGLQTHPFLRQVQQQ